MNVSPRPVNVMAIRVARWCVLAGVCCLANAFAQAVSSSTYLAPVVVAVSSGTGAAYEQAEQALERSLTQALRQDGKVPVFARVDAQDETAPLKPSQPAPRLYIALGVQACAHLARQLDLIRLALPQARRIGMLVGAGPGAQQQEEQLTELARERGLRLVSARLGTSDPIFPGLKQVLDESDVLLAMADPQIYNSHTIQNILLASFRAKVPMQAFSPAYVRAGALLALYATPEQIGAQVALLARDALTEQNGRVRGFGPPQHTQWFEVSVNAHVARSLGLQLDADDLAERLRRLESKAWQERKSSAPRWDARDRLAQVGLSWGSW